ncbi:MAG: hypothetical protein GC154_08705 [bacterium]|nr:hypothetical protein [bacterium]
MRVTLHPMDQQWDAAAKARYRDAYPELLIMFRDILSRSFLRNHWIPDPLALDYLTKVLIRFLPMPAAGESTIQQALAHCGAEPDSPREMIRYYETIGEMILWWSSLFGKPVYQDEGKRSYAIAYEHLSEYELPAHRIVFPNQPDQYSSKRLKVNKMFSEQFGEYQQVLEKASVLDDPAYRKFRDLFMTDDFSIN